MKPNFSTNVALVFAVDSIVLAWLSSGRFGAYIPMKKCPYCGAEYPDELDACPVDQTPFDKNYQPNKPVVVPAINPNVVVKSKVPNSLSAVSYLFLVTGILGVFGIVGSIKREQFPYHPEVLGIWIFMGYEGIQGYGAFGL